MQFDFTPHLAHDLPPAAQPWGGYPAMNFVGGHNDRESIPVEALIAAITRQLTEHGRELATYHLEGGPQGMSALREVVVAKARARGIETGIDEVMITSGSLQGLDLVNAVLINPGDTVLIEEHTYGGMLGKVRRAGAGIVGMPLDSEGVDVEALARILDELKARGVRPKYLYTIPTVQNPTGAIMSVERRQALLALARAHGVPIFEDECYADLVWDGDAPPALRAMDDSGQVIHIGSFSKTLAPALRLGYMIADWRVMAQMLPLKGDAGTGALEQMAVAEYFGSQFDAHLAMLKPRLKAKLDVMAEAVSREFGTAAEFTVPRGGIFFWMRLPGVDTGALLPPAAAEGLQFTPGADWSTPGSDSSEWLRLCFALTTPDEIRTGVARLAEICRRETGIPSRSANVAHSAD